MRSLLLPVMLSVLSLVPGRVQAAGVPLRLIDRSGRTEVTRLFDGVTHRILPPHQKVNAFPLGNDADFAKLVFSTGLQPVTEAGSVQFRILLRSAEGNLVTLYDDERANAGWRDEQIDLSGYDLRGARLDFVKRLVTGSPEHFSAAIWGEPILLPKKPRRRPPVILISIDTLRSDRVGAYGYADATTPALDAFAAQAMLYTDSYSASTWTLPSHHALLRGVDPTPFERKDRPGGWWHRLPPPLADAFRDAGYLTAGFTGGGYVSASYRFADGFDSYTDFVSPVQEKPPQCPPERLDGPTVFRQAGEWMRTHSEFPFFLFVHTYDVHNRCEVSTPDYQWFKLRGSEERRKVGDNYDSQVTEVDTLFGGFLRDLEAAGIADDAFVVVTSDHGESLWEHGDAGHGCTMKPYEDLVRVPLMVRTPGGEKKGRVERPVSALAVAPTLLRLVGLPVPESMRGAPLPGLDLDANGADEPAFVHCDTWLAVRAGHLKLITKRGGTSLDVVYDLSQDPGEHKNVVGEDEAVTRTLQQLAAKYWQEIRTQDTGGQRKEPEIDESTRERLRALGYLE